MSRFISIGKAVAAAGVLLILGVSGYFGYRLHAHNAALEDAVAKLEGDLAITEQNLSEATQTGISLSDALYAERQKTHLLTEQANTFATAVQNLTGRVTTLDKLTKTDPELLIKYSKVYFLNENYTPEALTQIPAAYIRDTKDEYFLAKAFPRLESLLRAAKEGGAELKVVSAYRSFDTQKDIKSQYKVTYGTGANKFSAEQGYSEHQLGTAVDFTTPALGSTFEKLDTTTAFFWLTENAHKHGFVLSYPKGNSYYIYEPWHWRYVGVELATKLKNDGKNFYDMDQREIDEYLVRIFD